MNIQVGVAADTRPPRSAAYRPGRDLAEDSRLVRIVAIGGGTGLPGVIEGLAALDGSLGARSSVTAIVTVTDNGGSSGRLRREFGVLPPGDVRNCLAAAAAGDSRFRQLLQHRFSGSPGLDGHAVGNLLLAALTQITGDFAEAVQWLSEMMGVPGRVLPTTNQNVHLKAELVSGEILTGETEIVSRRVPIKRLSLEPSPRPLPEVLRALVNADAVIVGPGSLYSSVLPNLLVEGIASTLSALNAVRIYVANLMTEPGETDAYTLDDHLHAIRAHTGCDLFDYILVNRGPIDPQVVASYAERGSHPVTWGQRLEHAGTAQLVECDLTFESSGGKIRHEPAALARAIAALVEKSPRRHGREVA